MALSPTGSRAGGPVAGTYLPVANADGVTVDTTTYADTIKGGGAKLTTLVFPASPNDQGAFAIALAGDLFPRWVLGADAGDYGLSMGKGSVDPTQAGQNYIVSGSDLAGGIGIPQAQYKEAAARLDQLSPKYTITSGALPTVAPVSGVAFQCVATRDVFLCVPFTGDATNNAATLLIQVSPNNVTFSTLDTLSIAAALNLTGAINVPVSLAVPAGWYVKLTAVHGAIGTGTYY